jgi:ATP adenylyltransferase
VGYEQLWAPWRLSYVQGGKQPEAEEPDSDKLTWVPGADRRCFICQAVADPATPNRLVVLRGEQAITILNRYPYNNGHLMVAPLVHKARLDELTAEEQAEIMQTLTRMVGLLEKVLQPQGFNLGLNLGRVAGAGLPGHLHWHVVPRWRGDTNFMPVVAGVNVIPQSLEALRKVLTEELGSGK